MTTGFTGGPFTFSSSYHMQGDPGQQGGGGDKPPGWKEGDPEPKPKKQGEGEGGDDEQPEGQK